MHIEFCRNKFRRYLAIVCSLAGLALDAPLGMAQMQIPNPLIRPRSLTSGNSETGTAPDTVPQRPAAPPPSYSATPTLGGPSTPADDPYQRDLVDLRDRMSSFYVSAIVGKKAILRRSAYSQRAGSSPTNAQATGTSMAPLPLNSSTNNQSSRNDSITVSDGELLEAVSNTGTLMTKVANGRVVIYHIQELGNLPGGRLAGRRAIVFAGDVENSGTPAAAAIVLERTDPAFKRSITVDTKVRSASAVTQDASVPNSTAAAPQLQ